MFQTQKQLSNMEREDHLFEELCKKGKAYRAKRMAAGEKSSAYLSGRAVKVCKGQMKSEGDEGEEFYIIESGSCDCLKLHENKGRKGFVVVRTLKAGDHFGEIALIRHEPRSLTVRAKEEEEALRLIEDAKLLERLGCFALVLEKIPASLAQQVAESISIPVIGIGAGGGVDGQVLVLHDMLGMTQEFHPRFLRRYLSLHEEMTVAINQYIDDVKSSDFPSENEQY